MEQVQTIDSNQEQKFKKLRVFNLVMGFLHTGQGILMLVLSSKFALPVTTAFIQYDPAKNKLAPVLNTIYNLRIGPLIACFLFISALAHFIISIPAFKWYVKNLGQHINKARWVEYAFSSSIMMVIIAMLVGIYDIVSLISIFGLNAMMILFGWIMELHNQSTQKTNWLSFFFGCIGGALPWIGVAIYLFGAGGATGKPPTFVYWIFFSIFLFFNVFAINMVLQYKKVGRWRDYLYGERVYIILSLVAKSLLAWQVFFGTLRPV